jgi:hypothetical protein
VAAGAIQAAGESPAVALTAESLFFTAAQPCSRLQPRARERLVRLQFPLASELIVRAVHPGDVCAS